MRMDSPPPAEVVALRKGAWMLLGVTAKHSPAGQSKAENMSAMPHPLSCVQAHTLG